MNEFCACAGPDVARETRSNAMTMIPESDLIIPDEPTSVLDVPVQLDPRRSGRAARDRPHPIDTRQLLRASRSYDRAALDSLEAPEVSSLRQP